MALHCVHCGTQLSGEGGFCPSCGNPVAEAASVPGEDAPPTTLKPNSGWGVQKVAALLIIIVLGFIIVSWIVTKIHEVHCASEEMKADRVQEQINDIKTGTITVHSDGCDAN